ncbi:glycosyltransferase [Flavobacterium sp. LS1P3]|uniref:glycosyltransferase n=1 Tax=Flavobacterium sp. LS1P3 TaxID=3401720 RepID=UPI003AB0E824
MKVLFVEEPIAKSPGAKDTYTTINITENIDVFKPKVDDIEDIALLLKKFLKSNKPVIGWFYSSSFSPLLTVINFETVIYDCMDELSLFKGASKHLINQEKFLLSHADIVFTGGKSLFESKKNLHSNVYCFPSSVDETHFAKAQNGIEVPSDIFFLKNPIVGYYGVIDERIDLELLHNTAKILPNVSFVMIGPLAKIEDGDLPKDQNIYYLGMRSYEVLPNYLKAFDIAMMPFALNESTKYISPTKTLEFMAADKPIISTKIKDVVRDYENCINLIDTAEEFANTITTILDSDKSMLSKQEGYCKILKNTSWDATAQKMTTIINTFAK